MELPFVDEHDVAIEAPPAAVWEALGAVLPGWLSPRVAPTVAGALGSPYRTVAGPPTSVGSTLPGFRVAEARPPHELVLEGEHRFSRYRLDLRIEDLPGGRSRLAATTRAAFPGAAGRVYRFLVIETRGHVLAVRRVLGAVRRRAERG